MKPNNIVVEDMKKYFELDASIPEGLRWIVSNNFRIKIGDIAGCLNQTGYYCVKLNNKQYKNHRIIFAIFNNVNLVDEFIDHIDRNKQNNHESNLRICTHTENMRNVNKRRNSSSNFLGVSWHTSSNKWKTQITVDKKTIHIGRYSSEIEAAKAFNDYVTSHNLEFFNLNKL